MRDICILYIFVYIFFQGIEIENHFLPGCGRVFYFYFAGSYIFEIESPNHKHECVVHVAEYGIYFHYLIILEHLPRFVRTTVLFDFLHSVTAMLIKLYGLVAVILFFLLHFFSYRLILHYTPPPLRA